MAIMRKGSHNYEILGVCICMYINIADHVYTQLET